jgi:ribosomal-protein-alanine N-acetyltransferase
MLTAAACIATGRLTLRRPVLEDAEAMFRYASDPAVTRYMSWPMHRDVEQTRRYLEAALQEWQTQGAGAYVIERDGTVIGSTGLNCTGELEAATGYVLAQSAWGQGYATEACRAMIELGRSLGLARIKAYCHVDHAASARVLEKSGMVFEGILRRGIVFHNLSGEPEDVLSYAWTSVRSGGAGAQLDP